MQTSDVEFSKFINIFLCADVSIENDVIKENKRNIIASPIHFNIPGAYRDMKGRSKHR